jgi:hypothetical protein
MPFLNGHFTHLLHIYKFIQFVCTVYTVYKSCDVWNWRMTVTKFRCTSSVQKSKRVYFVSITKCVLLRFLGYWLVFSVRSTIHFVEEMWNVFTFHHIVHIVATGLHNLNVCVWFSVVKYWKLNIFSYVHNKELCQCQVKSNDSLITDCLDCAFILCLSWK